MITPMLKKGRVLSNQLLSLSTERNVPSAPPALCLPANVAMMPGNDIMDEAKIIGMTPAVLIFSGMCVVCPPIIRLPAVFLEYWTGICRAAPFSTTTMTIMAIIIAMTIRSASPPLAIVFPFTDCAYRLERSCGTRQRILIRRTMEIPLPTPFSLIRSPIHIRKQEPAVRATTTAKAFPKFIFGISP